MRVSSFLLTLFIVFLVLKLTGNVSWPWLWVTCPLWAAPALALVFMAACLLILFVVTATVVLHGAAKGLVHEFLDRYGRP